MERSVYTLSIVKLIGLRKYIYANLQFFQNFFLRVLFKMEYEDVVEVEAEHEARRIRNLFRRFRR